MEDLELAKQVISFYADKSNWKLFKGEDGNFTSKIALDNGAIASAALSGLSKHDKEGHSIWLTEELIGMQGYSICPASYSFPEFGCIIKHNSLYSGHDKVWTDDRTKAALTPFATKFLALLSLQKQLERRK